MAKSGNGPVILALVTDAWGGQGGIAQYNRDLLGALAASGKKITAFSLCPPSSNAQLPPGVEQSHWRGGKLGFAVHAFLTCARSPRPSMIFCGHINFAPLAATLCRLFRIPMWLQVHGIDAWERPGVLRTKAAEQANLVTAVSRHTRKRLLAWACIQPDQVKVLPNTVSDRFSPGPKPSYLLNRHDLRNKNILLTVGRLSSAERYKGHDLVIRALPDLLQQDPSYRYIVTGDGDDRNRLLKIAKELGVTRQVIFTGHVSDAELPDYYRLADTFVMPSTGEGFGIAFLEAAQSGLAVIGANLDGSVDALRDGALGQLVTPKPETVSLAIIKGKIKNFVEKDAAIFSAEQFKTRVSIIASTESFSECGEMSANV